LPIQNNIKLNAFSNQSFSQIRVAFVAVATALHCERSCTRKKCIGICNL